MYTPDICGASSVQFSLFQCIWVYTTFDFSGWSRLLRKHLLRPDPRLRWIMYKFSSVHLAIDGFGSATFCNWLVDTTSILGGFDDIT